MRRLIQIQDSTLTMQITRWHMQMSIYDIKLFLTVYIIEMYKNMVLDLRQRILFKTDYQHM